MGSLEINQAEGFSKVSALEAVDSLWGSIDSWGDAFAPDLFVSPNGYLDPSQLQIGAPQQILDNVERGWESQAVFTPHPHSQNHTSSLFGFQNRVRVIPQGKQGMKRNQETKLSISAAFNILESNIRNRLFKYRSDSITRNILLEETILYIQELKGALRQIGVELGGGWHGDGQPNNCQ